MPPQERLIMLLVEIAPFAVLFVLYALLAYPLYLKKKIWWHGVVAILLLVAFGVWCFTLGRHVPEGLGPGGPGFGFGGPRASGFGGPPELAQGPPPEFGQAPPHDFSPDSAVAPPPGPSLSQGAPPPPLWSEPGEPSGRPPGGHRLFGRFRPEFTKLFIALMMLFVERGFWDWLRSRSRKRKGPADAASVEERPDSAGQAAGTDGLAAGAESSAAEAASPAAPPSDDLVIKFARKTVTIPLGSIIYIESMSEYVKFHLAEPAEPVVLLGSLKKLMERLPSDRFIRIHRSYIVATDHIREAGTASVTLDGGLRLPIGDSFRPALKACSEQK